MYRQNADVDVDADDDKGTTTTMMTSLQRDTVEVIIGGQVVCVGCMSVGAGISVCMCV